MEPSIRVVVVEDDIQYLEEISLLLRSSSIDIVGTYTTGKSGLKGILEKKPQVALVDLGLPDISGIEVIRELLHRGSKTELLVLTVYDDDEHLFSALRSGAIGYIVKSEATPSEIAKAVKEVVRGGAPMSPGIARKVLKSFREFEEIKKEKTIKELTPREQEILEYLSEGFGPKKIAQFLNISYETVRVHLKNIYRKLQVNSLIEALATYKRGKTIGRWGDE